MVKLKIPVFDIARERASHSIYEILTASLDSHTEMYEIVDHQEGNDGYFKIYRDVKTSSAICIQNSDSRGYENFDYITLVGDEDRMDETRKRMKEIVPSIIVLEEILEESKH
jgi:hypothetical protein